MIAYTVRPISDRTAFTGKHTASKFGVKYVQVWELLDRELVALRAKDVVLEVDIRERDLRLDGGIRADARAASPGVRLAFDSKFGALVYATDAFVRGDSYVWIGAYDSDRRRKQETMRQDWQHNLYAIAKSLEALRMVDRYGVVRRGEQYAGFKQLGAARAMPAADTMDVDEAWSIIGSYDSIPIEAQRRRFDGGDRSAATAAFKRARFANHPDRRDGDRSLWDKVEEAGKVLGLVS